MTTQPRQQHITLLDIFVDHALHHFRAALCWLDRFDPAPPTPRLCRQLDFVEFGVSKLASTRR